MANVQFKLVPVDYSKPYDEQTDCKRHVVGAYANLARHNMTVTINAIMQAIGMPLFNENDIDDAFNKSHRKKLAQLDNIQKINLQKRLYRHFPFFKRMKLEDETKKSVQLNTLLEVMADFTNCMAMIRNFYTHYHPYNSSTELANQLELKKKMGKRLQYLFENTSQLFKSNEALDHESNEVFSALRIPEDYIEEFMPGDKEYQALYDLLKNPKVSRFKKQGLRLDMKTQKITKKAVRYIRNPEYQAYMMDDKEGMSDASIVYFLCLFLEKKVSFDLMEEVGFTKQIKFEGEYADKQLLYLKEMMCMNRIRMTKTKLDSEMTDTALALDMLNELRKCPKPLFDVFCKEAREEFKDDATVQWEQTHNEEAIATEENRDDENENEPETEKDTPRSTFVRWEDRFPQMALRYIDYQGLFKDIRFQLDLGKYRFAFYQHDKGYSIDNEERLRILQKEMHGFGRIQEVNDKKNEKWATLYDKKCVEDGLMRKKPDEAGQTPYVTEQNAQYAIDEKSHSIGLRWEGWQATGDAGKHYGDLDAQKMFIPYLPLRPQQEGKQVNLAEPLLAPQAMLSLYELPGLLFYQYLLNKQGKGVADAETIIIHYYNSLYQFFVDVSTGVVQPVEGKDEEVRKENLCKLLEGRKLRISDIPEKLRKFLLGISSDNIRRMEASVLHRLEERKEKKSLALEKFKAKKKIIGTKENKFDRMRASIKTGALGQLLARDIMEWLTDDTKKKMNLTGQNFVAMQTAITLLGQSFDDKAHEVDCAKLKDIFIKANILPENDDDYDADLHHPFLLNVLDDQPSSVEEFYELYLEDEIYHIDYIRDFFLKHKAKGTALYIPFVHAGRLRWQNDDDEAMKKLAARYLERPIQLPKGMFTESIFHLLDEIENPDLKNALEKAQAAGDNEDMTNNAAYLMRMYFECAEHDHSQPFYNTTAIDGEPSPYRHVYRIFKKLYGQQIPHTNKTTTPVYTIEELRGLRKQALMDIKAYVEEEVQTWEKKQQERFEQKLRKKLRKENDIRYKKHEKQLNINEEIRKAVQQEVNSIRKEATHKLERQLKKVYDNERIIRRYKTQDMLLLVMAREILKAKSQDKDFTKGFCLKYVMTESLLDKPIDFEWKVMIKDKEQKTITKTIAQKGMKMKNYGQFYKFASDHQRLESLLSRLPDDVFLRAEIENELSYYDANRSKVFRQVYIIESEAYKLMPELENDANAHEDWFSYTDRKGRRHPKRNNFLSLLEILAAGKDGILDEEEKRSLRSTRNAFGHNTYDVDLPAVFKGKKEKMKIPEVANGIKDKVEEQTEELKNNLKK